MALHFSYAGACSSVGQAVDFPEIRKVINQQQVVFPIEGEDICTYSFPGAVSRLLARKGLFLLFVFVSSANVALQNEFFNFSTHPRPEHTFSCSSKAPINADVGAV